jgi:ferredoxin like protein
VNSLTVANRLAKNHFDLDEGEQHIVVDQEAMKHSPSGDWIIAVCPAHVYAREPDGTISVEYAACLECGACLAVAEPGTLSWHYPRGGFGVQFREG